ncbi:Helix-turn-helix domain protein [compost metagenome]|jgi:predicted site-specific integrase-resolvase|uniref:helix-turn-helix domain-containing protein n=1 Tax=Pseudomonas sp. GM50 TaxID=1144332 RepID=UPI0002707922|nr:helix-turn-helix domain-containing protein [Pseudomonas sp. GM50]EJM61920.1 hypothetical protein PMI30_05058 [Pseudomonas sp. GM50]
MNEYLNPGQTAEILGVSVDTLRFWRYSGKHTKQIPAHKHISRRVFYKRSDVERFAETMYCPA